MTFDTIVLQKYWSVFKISFQQEFAYRVSFVMWRIRNVLQIFLVFFLWSTLYVNPDQELFGYSKERMLTYVFGLLIVKAFVLSSRTVDVAGEISRGDLSNYLVKPINYFHYWLTRDLSSKALNLSFAAVEVVVLYILLKPPFFIQTDIVFLFAFAVSVCLAIYLYFLITFIISSIPFWIPEAAWGAHFLFTVVMMEFLTGALFPLDILPESFLKILNLTPFPYLVFYPLKIYLGEAETGMIFYGVFISLIWVIILRFVLAKVWSKGMKAYQAYGR